MPAKKCQDSMERVLESEQHRAWIVAVFGAGHVAEALVRVLLPLECVLLVCDARPEWLQRLPEAPNVHAVHRDRPEELVAKLPSKAFIICMTRGHSTDRPILQEILAPGRSFAFVGVIGSKAKAAILHQELASSRISLARVSDFQLSHWSSVRHEPSPRNCAQHRGAAPRGA